MHGPALMMMLFWNFRLLLLIDFVVSYAQLSQVYQMQAQIVAVDVERVESVHFIPLFT